MKLHHLLAFVSLCVAGAASGQVAPPSESDAEMVKKLSAARGMFLVNPQARTSKEDSYSYAKRMAGANNLPAAECMRAKASAPSTGNSVVDTRCGLVVFEVCLQKAIGMISQSQDARKQCTIIKELGGKGACEPACSQAQELISGGSGSVTTRVATYTGLTPFAVSCFEAAGGPEAAMGTGQTCARNAALECLVNASSSATTNAAIRLERTNACRELDKSDPRTQCVQCTPDKGPRIDYAPTNIDLDSQYCTPLLAKAGYCVLSKSN